MNSGGIFLVAMTIIIVNILFDRHPISADAFTVLLLMAVVGTSFTVPLAAPRLRTPGDGTGE